MDAQMCYDELHGWWSLSKALLCERKLADWKNELVEGCGDSACEQRWKPQEETSSVGQKVTARCSEQRMRDVGRCGWHGVEKYNDKPKRCWKKSVTVKRKMPASKADWGWQGKNTGKCGKNQRDEHDKGKREKLKKKPSQLKVAEVTKGGCSRDRDHTRKKPARAGGQNVSRKTKGTA